jgi:hypothetical protein
LIRAERLAEVDGSGNHVWRAPPRQEFPLGSAQSRGGVLRPTPAPLSARTTPHLLSPTT